MIRPSHLGFSLIELMIVMVIMAVVFSIGVGSVLRAMQRNRVMAAADAVAQVHDEARRRSMIGKPGLADSLLLFGVAVVPPSGGSPGYAVLLRGSVAGDELMVDSDGDGTQDRAALKVSFAPGVTVFTSNANDGASPSQLSTPLVWWYAWGSGVPVTGPASSYPIGIGTPAQPAQPKETLPTPYAGSDLVAIALPAILRSPVCSRLEFRQSEMRVVVAVYPLGPVYREAL